MATLSTPTGATTTHHLAAAYSKKRLSVSRLSCVTYFEAPRRRRGLSFIRNCGDESAATVEAEAETPAEIPRGPPSLISALNVDKALRGLAITDADHYGRLGLRTGCSYDQVTAAYETKMTEVMNQGMDDEEVSKELELLKESHLILSSVEERRLYDWSLARSGKPDRYVWPFEVDITQSVVTGTPPPPEAEDEGPTRLVGYFVLGWLLLSFVLFIAFNR